MRYLLDINTLLALGHRQHAANVKAATWFRNHPGAVYYFCSILEMGFVRVSLQAKLQPNIRLAIGRLVDLKTAMDARLLSDDITAQDLPGYVRGPKQVTDGHLLALARRNDLELVTLDTGIPGAVLVQ